VNGTHSDLVLRVMRRCRDTRAFLLVVCTWCTLAGGPALAGPVVLSGTSFESGTGFGNVLSSLSVHQNVTEYGSVSWNGSANVVTDNATSPQSQTQTVAALKGIGITATNFSLVFDMNQEGSNPQLYIRNFSVVGYSSAGAEVFTALFDATTVTGYDGTLGLLLPDVGDGQGVDGHVFNVTGVSSGVSLATFFSDDTNRVGMTITSANAFGRTGGGAGTADAGADDFHFIATSVAVPEPSSIVLLGFGSIVGLLRFRRRAFLLN
jgi:hypothetical protein